MTSQEPVCIHLKNLQLFRVSRIGVGGLEVPTSDSTRIHDVCAIKLGLYVLHPEFQRVNFYSQQLRALALVEGIYRQGLLREGARSVAVIGAGIAGLTTAAALATVGANVTILEQEEEPLSRYRDAIHREIHPNIIAWPFQALRAITNLPFLNWSCGPVTGVRRQVLKQWKAFESKITTIAQSVNRIEWTASGILIHTETKPTLTKDLVVVTTGFLEEISGDGVAQNTYWHSSTMPRDSVVTVSGVGDGGLIDIATQFYGHQTVAAGRALAYALESSPIKQDIIAGETLASNSALRGDPDDSSRSLDRLYSRISIEPGAAAAVDRCEVDVGRRVNVYYRSNSSPYKPFIAPINKLLFSYCRSKFEERIYCTKGTWHRDSDGSIAFEPRPPRYDKTCVLMRHGAPHSAYMILDAGEIRIIEEKERTHADLLGNFAQDDYDKELFLTAPLRTIAPSSSNDFFANLAELLSDLLHHCAPGITITTRIRRDDKVIQLVSDDDTPSFITQMFPISVYDIQIRFVESGLTEYSTIPSVEIRP